MSCSNILLPAIPRHLPMPEPTIPDPLQISPPRSAMPRHGFASLTASVRPHAALSWCRGGQPCGTSIASATARKRNREGLIPCFVKRPTAAAVSQLRRKLAHLFHDGRTNGRGFGFSYVVGKPGPPRSGAGNQHIPMRVQASAWLVPLIPCWAASGKSGRVHSAFRRGQLRGKILSTDAGDMIGRPCNSLMLRAWDETHGRPNGPPLQILVDWERSRLASPLSANANPYYHDRRKQTPERAWTNGSAAPSSESPITTKTAATASSRSLPEKRYPRAQARDGTVAVVGFMPPNSMKAKPPNSPANGLTDPKYGRQFRAQQAIPVPPNTTQGIINYLSSGIVKGIGPMHGGERS